MYRKRRSDIFLLDRVTKCSFIKVQILFMIIRALLTLTRSSLQVVLNSLVQLDRNISRYKKKLTIIRNNIFLRAVFIFIISRTVMIYEINTDCWLDNSFSVKETG